MKYFRRSGYLLRVFLLNGLSRTGAVFGFVFFLIVFGGCSATSTPLSIEMYNPETKQKLTCAARDQLAITDTSVLAAAVEGCAKQLEARGFVRGN